MRHIIQFKIYKGEQLYIGEGIDVPVVTQGQTVDETIANIQEALSLHLEGEDLAEFDLAPEPSVLVTVELEPVHA